MFRGSPSRRRVAAVALAGLTAIALPTATGSGPAGASGDDAARAAVVAANRKADPKLSPRLVALATSPVARAASLDAASSAVDRAAGLPADGPGSLLRAANGDIKVDVRLTAVDDATLAALAAAGGTVIATSVPDRLVTLALVPADLAAVSAVPGVEYVEEVLTPIVGGNPSGLRAALAQGGVTTNAVCNPIQDEADTQLFAASARSTNSVDGSGVRVGVLSDSYNNKGGAATDVSNGELPGPTNPCGHTTAVTVQADAPSGGADEGRAMAQAVHDLAPGADIAFATAFTSDVDFANQIRTLQVNGADVIVDDITYFNEPIYQDGLIAKAARDVTAAGTTYFSSAANSNWIVGGKDVSSYEAPAYRPMACPSNITTSYGETDCHDFNTGSGTDSGDDITLATGRSVLMKLGWNEPEYGITSDLDLFLVDNATGTVVAGSTASNPTGTKKAYELLSYANSSGVTKTYSLVVGRYQTTATPRFKIISMSNTGISAVQYNTSTGGDVVGPTSYGHNMLIGAGSIAAIPYNSNTAPEYYSSRGPATSCWGPVVGTTAATAVSPCKVDTIDVTATDGGSNSFFGSLVSSVWRFYGTSQAAPHAAAVAALQKDHRPCATPAQILEAQRFSGIAIGSFGVDAIGGGRLDARAALANLPTCAARPGYAPFASWNALIQRFYNDLIGRAPTSGELSSWSSQLSGASKTPGDLAAALRVSSDNVTNVDPVTRLYRAYFLRIPDKGGLTYWIGQRRGGKSLNTISDTFAGSSEFTNRYGSLTNRNFVNLVYTNVLGRPGEASGVDYWTAQLDQGKKTRGQVMTGFSESNEYKGKQAAEVDVSVAFVLLRGRGPTVPEFTTLVGQLEGHTLTNAGMVDELRASPGYTTHITG